MRRSRSGRTIPFLPHLRRGADPTCGLSRRQPKNTPRQRAGVHSGACRANQERILQVLLAPAQKKCVGAGILGYICAGITAAIAVSGIVETIGITALLDAGITLTLSLLIHLLKSRVAATLLLVYAVVSIIIMLATTGQFSGWLIALAAIWGMNGAFAANKEWQMYQLRNRNADATNTGAPTAL